MRLLTNYLTLSLLVLLLLYHVTHFPLLKSIIGVMTFLCIMFGINYSSKLNKFLANVMMIIGLSLLIYNGETFSFWLEALTKNLPLVCLIVLTPMLSIPVKLGQYDHNISNIILRYAKNTGQLYFFISNIFFVLSPLLNIGALHLIHSIVEKLKLPKKFLGRVYIRSFLSANLWAPYFISVFLVIYFLKIPLNDYVFYGLILAVAQILVSYLLFVLWEQNSIQIELTAVKGKVYLKKLIEFTVILILIICTIFLSEEISDMNITIIITIILTFFTIVWSLYLKQIRPFLLEAKQFFHHIIPRSSNEIVLFLSAGFFGAVISSTYLSSFINTVWQKLAEMSILITIIVTILTIMLFSFIGIHQIVTITIILTNISHQLAGVSNIVMAMTLLGAYSTGAIISPVSPANLVVANLINEGIYRLIIRYNLIFAIVICFIQSFIIYGFYCVLK